MFLLLRMKGNLYKKKKKRSRTTKSELLTE